MTVLVVWEIYWFATGIDIFCVQGSREVSQLGVLNLIVSILFSTIGVFFANASRINLSCSDCQGGAIYLVVFLLATFAALSLEVLFQLFVVITFKRQK